MGSLSSARGNDHGELVLPLESDEPVLLLPVPSTQPWMGSQTGLLPVCAKTIDPADMMDKIAASRICFPSPVIDASLASRFKSR